jgi:hypothetical protein
MMMGVSQSVPELIAAARENAKPSEACIEEILIQYDLRNIPEVQVEELRAATVALELIAVDIFSVFEARMQHHFKRGPFSRKLKALLLAAKRADLADRVHQYYLAVNVLKHGRGASYRELLETPKTFLVVKPYDAAVVDAVPVRPGLVDVAVPGFIEGLTTTILEAFEFLENR